MQEFGRRYGPAGLRHAGLIAASCVAVWLLRDHIAGVDPAAVMSLFAQFSPLVWIAAAGCTALSLIAVGGYDVVIARVFGLSLSSRDAFSAGWKATAIAQTLGFGLITGALVRWRALGRHPELSLWTCTQITAAVTGCFFGGWALVAGGVALIAPDLPDRIWWMGVLALWAAVSLAVLSLRHPKWQHLPPLRMIGSISALTLLDTLAAAAVIFVFLPEGYTPFLMLYSAFMIAFGVGMISAVPGGVGPFELCLLALLSPVDPTPLLAACLGYRAVYYLCPAVLAGALLVMRGQKLRPSPPAEPASLGAMPHRLGLLAQGQLELVARPTGACLGRTTVNSEVLLFDPDAPCPDAFLADRLAATRRAYRGLFLYKFGARTREAVCRLGLRAHAIGSEAVLDPDHFTLDIPARAELRRKLRRAAKAGVEARAGAAGWRIMAQIDAQWQARNGTALGFSMGGLDRALLSEQAVFTAYQGGAVVAFVSFHVSPERWTLDVMRSADGAPDGTMHALIIAAVEQAKLLDVREFSLCSVPLYVQGAPETWLERCAAYVFSKSTTAAGLLRFKTSFAPEWHTQYVAGSSLFGLLTGAYETYRLIHNPPTPELQPNHNDYDLYEFASQTAPCDRPP